MLPIFAWTTLLVSASALVARADVVPSEPGPGASFNAGAQCHLSWGADTDSPTAWKNMVIELMTGSNFDMVALTTVTTGQDGTVDGTFDFPCPQVNPNSAIYFYQFTAPTAANKTWTTRFTIASSTGASVPPANTVQPNSGASIPWGTGALADPSTAVPPPGGANSTSSSPLVSSGTGTPSSSALPLASSTPSSSISRPALLTASSGTAAPSASIAKTNGTLGANAANAAEGRLAVHTPLWRAAAALGASAVVFAVFM